MTRSFFPRALAALCAVLVGLGVPQSLFAQSTRTAPVTAPAPREVAPLPSLAPMIREVSPSVVSIAIRGSIREQSRNPLFEDPFFRRFFNVPPDAGTRERPFQSAGSGVIIDAARGHIVTNAHVVENAREITVTLADQRELKATVIGSDPRTDIAVIRIEAAGLRQIVLGDSDQLEPGDYVAAIGNPFGLQQSVSYGIVSALGRSGMNPDGFESLIQTDASINPGNSGGALVNLRGELVGINNMILSGSGGNIGIGFAIPVNMARSIAEQLIEFGAVRRGQLGVTIAPLTPDIVQALGITQEGGALVTQVVKDSAAARAGLRAGDVVTALNGKRVRGAAEFRNAIGLLRIGDRVDLEILREGKAQRLRAQIADPAGSVTADTAVDDAAGAAGTEPQQHPALQGALLADAANGSGVRVESVEPGSAAARAGLREQDRIVSANGRQVADRTMLAAVWRASLARGTSTLVLQVRRGDEQIILLLR